MREIFYMVKRNCLIFWRDRSAVFFSLLSTLIVLALMVIFLGKMNSGDLVNILAQYGGDRDTVLDEKNAGYLVQLWTLAGILVVNAVSVNLTVLSAMVRDEAEKRIMAFYVTPVKRYKLSLGYILSAWLVSSAMCLFTLAVGEIYFLMQGNELLAVESLLKLCGMIVLNTFTFAAIGYVMALFVHSSSAWSGILTIVGTLVGFAGGIYLNISGLAENVQTVLKCLPVLHGASMMRQVCTEAIIGETFAGLPEEVVTIVRERMGITVVMGEKTFSVEEQMIFLLAYAIIAVVFAVLLNKRRKLKGGDAGFAAV